jgi:surface carbohydrate biosynthesis protein
MNIYINVEITSRELDSKLLLATLAAARGHQVLVSDLESILKGMKSGALAPGIFHTKSLTPSNVKIARYKSFISRGFKITSIDEEAGLDMEGYEEFSTTRFSEQMIGQASAIFGWGDDDVQTLQKVYSKHSSKIYKTGSPRVDLWKSIFSDYWGIPKSAPERPFLLVSSNMSSANGIQSTYERLLQRKKSGYLKRRPKLLNDEFIRAGDACFKTNAFIEAVKYLSNSNKGYDIVFRPHPTENIEAWKLYLEGIPNVHVIREGSISQWVNNSFAVMHNGCTTAIEATVSKKPLITYIPFQTDHDNHPPNKLGYRVESLEDLLLRVNTIFENFKSNNQKDEKEQFSYDVSKKLYLDKNELAAEKIVSVWDSFANDSLSCSSNLMKFQWLLKVNKFRKMIGNARRLLLGKLKENNKFPLLDNDDVNKRVSKLQNILGIKGIKCELLSDRTILIKGKKFI